ncbi:hypothetical protein SUGI_0719090 [Cryptomeria japonica]|nr:hypothetical protein SUGI_0719090 [Cryptomeria japonica]
MEKTNVVLNDKTELLVFFKCRAFSNRARPTVFIDWSVSLSAFDLIEALCSKIKPLSLNSLNRKEVGSWALDPQQREIRMANAKTAMTVGIARATYRDCLLNCNQTAEVHEPESYSSFKSS